MEYIRNERAIKALGQQIRKIRTQQHISQEHLANSAGLTPSQIGRIERGEINTSISTLFVIAKELNVHPKELLDFEISN